MTLAAAQQFILDSIQPFYDFREARNIAALVMEKITGYSAAERHLYKKNLLKNEQANQLEKIVCQLKENKPVQYILEEAWFAGMKFFVNEHVLIPRPETEELVSWIVESIKQLKIPHQRILDIGTGSGCIAIALKKHLPATNITAIDIDKEALAVANQNAIANHAAIDFIEMDILASTDFHPMPSFDIIVSNPPYVLETEKREMLERVWKNEPSKALFVPDKDPLIFYKAIFHFAERHLKQDGFLFFEINETMAVAIQDLFESKQFQQVEIKIDFQEKARMVRAKKE